eukprot:tig00020909_g15356.t1
MLGFVFPAPAGGARPRRVGRVSTNQLCAASGRALVLRSRHFRVGPLERQLIPRRVTFHVRGHGDTDLTAATPARPVELAGGASTSAANTPSLRTLSGSAARFLGRALIAYAAVTAINAGLGRPAVALSTAASGGRPVAFVKQMLHVLINFDEHLAVILAQHGRLTYAFLFAIVFCETGLVVTPFLPGDSLLFVAGAFASSGGLKLQVILALLFIAAVLGDSVNYFMGSYFGVKLFQNKLVKKILSEDQLRQTEKFYEKHGKRAVVLARFLPIIRTIAPFVAGIGSMDFPQFMIYNVVGAILWVFGFCGLGYFFGNLPWVHQHFTAVILGIVVLSVIPPVLEIMHARRSKHSKQQE